MGKAVIEGMCAAATGAGLRVIVLVAVFPRSCHCPWFLRPLLVRGFICLGLVDTTNKRLGGQGEVVAVDLW
jgi:hypothetical protein